MAFLLLGVLLGALKLLDIGPTAAWSWWVVLSPFVLAALWWAWADWSGYTRRKEMDKMDERREARRRKNMVALGIDPRAHDKRSARAAEYRARRAGKAAKTEAERAKKQRDSIISKHTEGELASSDDRPSWIRSKS
jgi:small Trp-rich protein